MALTKIKLNTGMVTGSLPDANIPDDLTINSAGITQSSGTLTIKNANSDSNGLKIFQDTGDASKIYNHYNGTLQLGTGNTTKLEITSEGRVIQKNTTLANSCFDIVNGSSSGYGLYVKAGNSTNYALSVNSYDAYNIIDARLNSVDFPRAGTFRIGYGNSADYGLTIQQNVTSGLVKYSFDVRNNGTDYDSRLVFDRGNVGINCDPSFLFNVDYGAPLSADRYIGVFQSQSTRQFAIGWDDSASEMAIGTRTNHSLAFFTNGISNPRMTLGNTGMLNIGNNSAGSAGVSLKQLSIGTSSSTQFSRNNVGTFTGIIVSNSYTDSNNQSGTATGIAFSHHTSSSGISYIASVAGSNNGDRSALHFGTRGSNGVQERLLLNDNGEVYIGHGGDGYLKHYQINSNAHHWVLYPYSDDSYRFNRNGSGSDEMKIESDGDVVILGSLTQNSDIRLKENIETIPNALSKVNQLRGVSYNWNETSGRDTEAKQIGMIADEVQEVLPELVKVDSVKGSFDEDGLDNVKSLKYGNVVGLLVEAVKELSAKVEELENA